MNAEREMTLDEWCGRLPPEHAANKELATIRAHIEALEARVRELEGDAARYRWLRETSNLIRGIGGHIGFACGNWHKDEADKRALDAAIDSAMQGEEVRGG